jgi:hypothetical protein
MPGNLDALKRRLSVAYEIALPDEQTLTFTIYRQRVAAWQQTLTEEAAKLGSRKTGKAPSGVDAAYLQRQSREDAQSIRRTFQRDLEREIERLFNANPQGDRAYYIANLEQWADTRAQWKDRQIALYNNKTAQYYAQQRFHEMNKIVGASFRFMGPAPACDDCGSLFAAGVVDQAYVEENPAPVHTGCPHWWESVDMPRPGVPLNELWVG